MSQKRGLRPKPVPGRACPSLLLRLSNPGHMSWEETYRLWCVHEFLNRGRYTLSSRQAQAYLVQTCPAISNLQLGTLELKQLKQNANACFPWRFCSISSRQIVLLFAFFSFLSSVALLILKQKQEKRIELFPSFSSTFSFILSSFFLARSFRSVEYFSRGNKTAI